MVPNWIMIIAGIWAMISPWVLGFSSISIAKWNGLIIGLVMVLLGMWTIFGNADVKIGNGDDSEKGRDQKS